MSVLGVGYDLIELEQIRRVLGRFGERFLRRCYTEAEIEYCRRFRDPVPSLAARYAAKEAGSKALGTGIAHGVSWREIEVRRQPGHSPSLRFYGRARELAQGRGVRYAHVSLTHARQVAGAIVILEGDGPDPEARSPFPAEE